MGSIKARAPGTHDALTQLAECPPLPDGLETRESRSFVERRRGRSQVTRPPTEHRRLSAHALVGAGYGRAPSDSAVFRRGHATHINDHPRTGRAFDTDDRLLGADVIEPTIELATKSLIGTAGRVRRR
jgi:hypothetical protein